MNKAKPPQFLNTDFEQLKNFVKKEVIPSSRARDLDSIYPLDLVEKLHSLGWTRCFIPTELGGMGVASSDLTQIYRAIAYGSPGIAFSLTANMTSLLSIFMGGTKELCLNVAKDYQERFSLSSFCFTEPDHGSDVLRIETKAERVPGGFLLTGKKCFITNANVADRFIVVARVVGLTNPKHSLALFLVEGKPAGFTVGTGYSMLGLRDSNTSEIFLDQVFVPSSHLIGKEGEGFQLACKAIQRSRTMLSASAVGICDRSHDITREYLSKRELYGKTLLTHHTIMNLLSQLHAEKEAAWHLVQSAAHQWDEGINSFIPSSMAKLLTGQVAMKTASACLELFGGWGCTKEYEIERIFRDAKFCEIVEGPNLVQLAILAKELFPENKSEQKKAA